MDQVRVPQGSLFIELYCPRSPTNQSAPTDLYNAPVGTAGWTLDVGRVAPDGTPVWRIVVSGSRFTQVRTATPSQQNDVGSRLLANPDSSAIEPEQYPGDTTPEFSMTNSAAMNVQIDRQIFMTTTPPPATVTGASTMSFYNYGPNATRSNANVLPHGRYLPAGQYLVLGPRGRTYIGTQFSTQSLSGIFANASKQYIDLVTNAGVTYVNNGGATTSPLASQIKQPYTMILASPPPTGWGSHPHGVGLNLSEPLYSSAAYYGAKLANGEPKAPGKDDWTTCGDDPGWYDTPAKPAGTYIDHPMETTQLLVPVGDPLAPSRPLVQDAKAAPSQGILQTGTTLNYKTLFLQRLANPSMPYNPVTNPYRTVDWLPVDLTVFNGCDYNVQDGLHGWSPTKPPTGMDPKAGPHTVGNVPYAAWDYDDPVPGDTGRVTKYVHFGSRQRGGSAATALAGTLLTGFPGCFNVNPWTQIVTSNVDAGATTNEPASVSTWPPYPAGTAPPAANANFPVSLQHTLGYLNVAFWTNPRAAPPAGFNARTGAPYIGDPVDANQNTFPWIAWNNRPYASPWELLLVPSSHPARLLWEYQLNQQAATPSPYTPNVASSFCQYNPYTPMRGAPPSVPYPYLLGFFQSAASLTTGQAPQLYRLLEYVGVPSRFVQTETFINPTNASSGSHSFHPPFNRIYRYREPGKINLNTIYSQDVFNGLMNFFPGTIDANNTLWSKFVRSRRGLNDESATNANTFTMPPSSTPTRFANPFRSFAGGDMSTFSTSTSSREIEATVLRSDPDKLGVRPLFQIDASGALPNAVTAPAQDPDRNPFFRYQAMSRLGNLVTTRSNVYAIWITVGYFQVTPVNPDAIKYPDGYQLGPELGSDTGEIERHRAFYIFDRTIPVGFVRGQDLNVEKALLLRRYIE
jgi:hypothetical protein